MKPHGRVCARSEDLPGLILSGDNRKVLLKLVPTAIEALYRHNGFADVKISLGSSFPNIEEGSGAAFELGALHVVADRDVAAGPCIDALSEAGVVEAAEICEHFREVRALRPVRLDAVFVGQQHCFDVAAVSRLTQASVGRADARPAFLCRLKAAVPAGDFDGEKPHETDVCAAHYKFDKRPFDRYVFLLNPSRSCFRFFQMGT